jgi:hypothetical protein
MVEFVDAAEQEYYLIAQTPAEVTDDTTHCEIHAALILGVSASTIPLPDHNQSPRNVYQSAMCKQAAGMNSTAYLIRTDNAQHITFGQRPLVSSDVMSILGGDKLPAGYNVNIAIMNYTGYNQEDSLIFCKEALERGLFRSVIRHCYTKRNKTAPRYKPDGKEEAVKLSNRLFDIIEGDVEYVVSVRKSEPGVMQSYLRSLTQGRYWTGGFGLHIGSLALEFSSYGENIAFQNRPRVNDRKYVGRYAIVF